MGGRSFCQRLNVDDKVRLEERLASSLSGVPYQYHSWAVELTRDPRRLRKWLFGTYSALQQAVSPHLFVTAF